jgi:hypothetical protein
VGSPCRPAEVCGRLLAALDASEGRRRRRKRDTTPDSLGMAIKRTLLEETVRDDPDPDGYEGWLLERCLGTDGPSGPVQAMAREIFGEWRLAKESSAFRSWLQQGAPSDDASERQRSRQRKRSILE